MYYLLSFMSLYVILYIQLSSMELMQFTHVLPCVSRLSAVRVFIDVLHHVEEVSLYDILAKNYF